MEKNLKRIMQLVEKTGDRCVITDTEDKDAYVLMNLSEYENSFLQKQKQDPQVNSFQNKESPIDYKKYSEEEFLDYISEQISKWKEFNQESTIISKQNFNT